MTQGSQTGCWQHNYRNKKGAWPDIRGQAETAAPVVVVTGAGSGIGRWFGWQAYRTDPVLRDVDDVSPGLSPAVVDIEAATLNPLNLKMTSGAMREFFP
ncbi:hypothetical protein GCM10017566_62470 [Amycolatopsis bartoniae]|uniref:Uncharacterized protein n=1 Tax=Amycolatopsis bartoniae TaxID=941986 RepID=A0A8H9MER6_9PSEU|nr:hypothetical protein GCM10017566_62470 [Amycolatopsis bartoniae]